MGVAPVSGTGQATKRPTNATSRKWHWLTRWATKLSKPIGAATLSKRGVNLWRHGLAMPEESLTLLLSFRESRSQTIGGSLQDQPRSRARRRICPVAHPGSARRVGNPGLFDRSGGVDHPPDESHIRYSAALPAFFDNSYSATDRKKFIHRR